MENFDVKALTWDNEPKRIERAKVIAAALKKAIPNLATMNGFEYGCGTGLLSFNLQSALKHITLGDSSQGMIEVVKQKIAAAEVANMTGVVIDLATDETDLNDKFDIIYTVLALHHILDIDKIIAVFSQMLSQSGYLCIADLVEEDGSFHGPGFVGHNGFKQNELIAKLSNYGFKLLNWDICYENAKKFEDGSVRKYPLFLMIAQKGFKNE